MTPDGVSSGGFRPLIPLNPAGSGAEAAKAWIW